MRSDRNLVRILLNQLNAQKIEFSKKSSAEKFRALRALRRLPIRSASDLIAYHDLLLFLCAYPENDRLRQICRDELRQMPRRVRRIKQSGSEDEVALLLNSGLVDTEVSHLFSYDLARLLHSWYGHNLELDWAESDEDESGAISAFLPLLISFQENDTLDNAADLTTREWLHRARGSKMRTDLEALLTLLERSGLTPEVQRHLYDSASVVARWSLGRSQASRTLARVSQPRTFFQEEPIRPRTPDLRKEILSKPPALKLLSTREGAKYVRVINEVLAVRYRELYPITGANPAEVYRADPGRGVQIYLFGAWPEFRLPLEANFGAMLIRNGITIGYGVGACLFERVEIAINIFPAFRTGESSFVIEQFFKLFHHYFGSTILLVRSRQVGDGDDEPIQSGAFWFYYKLGFRPVKPAIRALAEKEALYLAAHPGYRSTVAKLKRLSKSDVFLDISSPQRATFRELSLVNLGFAVTDLVGQEFGGNRRLAESEAVKRVSRWLGISSSSRWNENEKKALVRMAPLLAAAPEISGWTKTEKSALADLIRTKGGNQERRFVSRSITHARFKNLLERIAATAARRGR